MQNISRRQFAHRLFQILMAGGFAHFTFTDTVLATDSPFLPPLCPGGGHSQDFCQPATSESEETDTCPGGRDMEDNLAFAEANGSEAGRRAGHHRRHAVFSPGDFWQGGECD